VRIRIILSFLLVISISLLGVSLLVRQGAQDEVQAFLGRGGLIGAETLVNDLESFYSKNGSWDGAETIMPRNNPGEAGGMEGSRQPGFGKLATLRLVDADGILLYDPVNPGSVGSLVADISASISLVVNDVTVGYLLPQEGEYAQENAQFEEQFLERINKASLIAAAISGAVAVVLAMLLAFFLTKPVKVLVSASEMIAAGNLAHRVDIEKPEELARLGDTFNRMAAALEQADKRRKSLSADIAHELRTPLAVQRANLEALMDGVYPATQENIQTVLDQNELLSRLVEDLRVITLTDSGELNLDLQTLELSKLIDTTIEQFNARAGEKDIEITRQFDSCGMVHADAQRVQQILHNLFQNSIRHTPHGGRLYLQLSCDGQIVIFTMRDTGPGIPEESLPYIFDRFYRADRSRSKEDGGTGLGLAIARNLARAHEGDLSAENHPDGGAIFTLRLPLQPT